MRVNVALRIDVAVPSIENCVTAKIYLQEEEGERDGRYLFQPKELSNIIYICDLKSKKIRKKEVEFYFPRNKAFCHVSDDYFLAGG